MRHISLTLLLTLLLTGFGLTACENLGTTPPAEVQHAVTETVIRKSPNDDRRYAVLTLPNQLQAVLVSDPSVEVTAVSMGVGVGSYQDPAAHPGLAHYLEHMLFLGTEKYPEPNSFQKFVDQNAGIWNAFTAADHTNYFFQLNADKIDQALDYFSDYFKKPTFDPQYSDKERNAVHSEWSSGRSQDNWIMYRLNGITANPEHPAAQFNVGNLETLTDKPGSRLQDALLAFYDRYYSANNMKLTIVGRQSLDELKALTEKHFASIPNKNIQPPVVTTPGITPAQMGKTIHYQSIKDTKQLLVEFPITDNSDQWRLKPNEFINNLITSEEAGTLGEVLRREGLANAVYGYVVPDNYGPDGFLRVIVEMTDKGMKQRDKIVASVFAYIDLIKQQGVEERYFKELKAMREKDFASQAKAQPVQQAIELSRQQFDYPVEHLLDANYVFERFDETAIRQVLEQLQPQRSRIWYVSKTEKADQTIPFYEGRYAIRDTTAAEFARWEKLGETMQFKLPPENQLFSDETAEIVAAVYDHPTLIMEQPGAEVWLMHAQHYREDKAMLDLNLNVNFALDSARNIVLASLLNDVFALQTTTLRDRAGRAGLDITIDLTPEKSQMIRITGYSSQQPTLFTDLIDHFAQLKINEQDFAQVLDRYRLERINARKAAPTQQLFNHMWRLLYVANWTDEELLTAANQLTRADLVAYHQRVLQENLLRGYAFGNLTEETVKAIAGYAVEQFNSQRVPQERFMLPMITPNPQVAINFREAIDQTDNALLSGVIGTEKSVEQHAQLMLLNGVFSNEFFTQLRTNEQMGYTVGSAPINVDDYPMFVLYVQSTNTELPAIKDRMDRFRQEFLTQLQALDEATLEQMKQAEIAQLTQKPTDFTSEAREHLYDFKFGHLDFARKEKLVAALSATTKADIVQTYETLLLQQQGMPVLIQLKGTHFINSAFVKKP